jgi:carboxypeptidase T
VTGYHDNEALLAEITRLVEAAGERARSASAGRTIEGREIPLLHVAAPGRVPSLTRPQALLTANLHGNEVIASEVALGVLARLIEAEPTGPARELLQAGDLLLLPAVNLDSREPAARALAAGRPWARSRRGNARGVDLNRNFPIPEGVKDVWHPLAGTSRRWLPWYRGPAALSEPESLAVATLVRETRPRTALGLHSTGGLFLHPFCHSHTSPPRLERFLAMGRAFAARQGARPYEVKQARSWYAILGDLDDWMYEGFGTLAVTVELSRLPANLRGFGHLARTLGWMNPPCPEPVVHDTVDACLAALTEGLREGAEPSEGSP